MSKFNEGNYPLERSFDDNNALRKPSVAASAAPNVQQDVRTPLQATGRLTVMANAEHQRPDA